MTREPRASRRSRGGDPHKTRLVEAAALRELERIRRPLVEESRRLKRRGGYHDGKPAHACCTRELNQMRISPLEAREIAHAFRTVPDLRAKLPQVLDRLEEALSTLKDTDDRQCYDCPLLDGTACLVHDVAKPVGCAAWHPTRSRSPDVESRYTARGWKAFPLRDALNDRLFGPDWKLRAIPLWLKRVFRRDLERRVRDEESRKSPRR